MARYKPSEQIAGIMGILAIIFIIALFVLFLDMIPDVLEWIQTALAVDEFGSKIVLFVGLIATIIGFSFLGLRNIPKKRGK